MRIYTTLMIVFYIESVHLASMQKLITKKQLNLQVLSQVSDQNDNAQILYMRGSGFYPDVNSLCL